MPARLHRIGTESVQTRREPGTALELYGANERKQLPKDVFDLVDSHWPQAGEPH